MAVVNQSRPMIDRPTWEQLSYVPAIGVGGTVICSDDNRWIYCLVQTSATASAFWRYDTWFDSWQQLATPPTQTGTINTMVYTPSVGGQWSGVHYGSVYLFNGNATTCYFYKYDIATNTWASALSVAGLPAGFGTDAYLVYPQASNNNWDVDYHRAAYSLATTSATAAVGATSVSITSLAQNIATGAALEFGKVTITLTSSAAIGATSISVSALSNNIASGAVIYGNNGDLLTLSGAASAGAATISVNALTRALPSGEIFFIRKLAILTSPATAGATSLAVTALLVNLATPETGYVSPIVATAAAAVGATTITVSALPSGLVVGTTLDFGKVTVTTTANAVRGDTTLSITALPCGLAAAPPATLTNITSPDGDPIALFYPASAGATSLIIGPLTRPLPTGSVLTVRLKATLTAAPAANATSITVSGLLASIAANRTAAYYDHMYLIGNNATQMYRYKISTNAWSTTSANSANPAFPAITGAPGTGCALEWLSAYGAQYLWCLRGGATASAYRYDLESNAAWLTETYYPATETFTTGTWVAPRQVGGKNGSLVIQKDATMRFFEGIPPLNTMGAKGTQWIFPTGAAVVGCRMVIMTSPDGIEFLYCLLHSIAAFVRSAFVDQ